MEVKFLTVAREKTTLRSARIVALIQSHGAEADCLALMRVTAAIGKDWLEYVHDNCYEFSCCKAMWGST